MSFRQYRSIDIALFVIMYAVCEFLTVRAATVWFDEPYSISIMLPLLVMVMMRWDWLAVVNAVAYALIFVFLQKGTIGQYAVYLIGNLGCMLTVLWLLKTGKQKVRDSLFISMEFLLISFLLMEIFRGLASAVILGSNIRVIIQFIFTDMLSLVFSVLLVIIVRRIDGLFEDQKHYLLRINSHENRVDGGWEDE